MINLCIYLEKSVYCITNSLIHEKRMLVLYYYLYLKGVHYLVME